MPVWHGLYLSGLIDGCQICAPEADSLSHLCSYSPLLRMGMS